MTESLLYVGTYTGRGSKGIYGFRFDSESGRLTALGLMAEAANPSFLAVDSSNSVLYAVNEVNEYRGEKSGALQAYKVDRQTGKLKLLNEVNSQGAGPCVLFVNQRRRYLFTANFAGGSIGAFPLTADGRIGEATAIVQHQGSGADPVRQNRPHPHDIALTRDGMLLIVADLGLDQLLMYRLDPSRGSISPPQPFTVQVHDGAGPRHFVMDHDQRRVYVVNETDSTVAVFSLDSPRGLLRLMQTVSSLPPGFTGPNDAAEIRLSPDGRFIYISNRGADTIQIFRVDREHGTLRPTESCSTHGKIPRSFEFSLDGRFAVVANHGSDRITVLGRNAVTGTLCDTGIAEVVSSPASLVFIPAA